MEDRIDRRGLRRACTLKRRHEALSSALVSEEDEREEVGPRSSDEGLGKVHRVSRVTAEFDVGGVRKSLLDWYVRERRDLPWRAEPFSEWETRKEKDPGAPYVVWVSEIMLQQTKVATVVDYFYRWMEVFPTVEALAAADLEKVNEVWAGLGYYRRAKMLHAGAKVRTDEHRSEGIRFRGNETPHISHVTAASCVQKIQLRCGMLSPPFGVLLLTLVAFSFDFRW